MGQVVAQLELERALRLGEAGCPVGVSEPHVDPIVSARDGFAGALERLHVGMREVDLASPRFTDRIAEAEQVAADPHLSPELADADRALLGSTLRSLRHRIDDYGAVEQLLHGEPHPGNLLGTKNGPLFIDFETLCSGPVEFDLAHVP